jgi:hypothetical protein
VHARFWPVFPLAQAVLSYWLPVHVAHERHTRSLVAVGAALWYWPVVQLVIAVQTRFCAVFPLAHATLSYWLPRQVVHELQTRLLVAVGAVL